MAKRRGYRGNPYNAKAYKFTARRRAALKKAQARSARERRIKVGIMAVGGAASVATVLYLGRNTAVGKGVRRDVAKQVRKFSPQHVGRAANLKRARHAVNPLHKEAIRAAGAISPAGTPAQPGHVGSAPLHIGPSTPGDQIRQAKPDPATFKRTDLGKEDPTGMRAALAAEEAYQKSGMATIARFTDTSEATLPQELVAGQPVRRGTAARAVGQHEAAKGRSGGQQSTKSERKDTVDSMIAGSIDQVKATRGIQTPIRTNPKANPGHIGAGSSLAEHDQIWAEYDAHRGLSTTRPGTVPHATTHASNKPVTPGLEIKGPILAPGQGVPGWHKLSKEGKTAMRGIAETAGMKVNAAGIISKPGAKKNKKQNTHERNMAHERVRQGIPPANPSGQTPPQQHATVNQGAGAFYTMPNTAPAHGSEVPNWNLFSEAQKHAIQNKFLERSRKKGWRTMLGASGSYFNVDN